MGIQKFTTVFPPGRELKYSDLNGKTIAIDARAEIYRGALGMKKLSENLTDYKGRPTTHINAMLLGVILKLKAAGAEQYWVFDYDQKRVSGEAFHVQLKELEIVRRRAIKEKAKHKLTELRKKKKALEERTRVRSVERNGSSSDSDLFSSTDDDEKLAEEMKACVVEIEKNEKKAFQLDRFYTDDVIFMLNMLDIPWIMSPCGFEAEQICALATQSSKVIGTQIDYVLTPDADALPFGSRKVIKRDIRKKKMFEYSLDNVLESNNITLDDLIKISLILGWEKVPKTPRIGPKTVLAKFNNVVLTEVQQEAFAFFKKQLTADDIASIKVNNLDAGPFSNFEKYQELLDWLQLEKCYNRARIDGHFKKIGLFCAEE